VIVGKVVNVEIVPVEAGLALDVVEEGVSPKFDAALEVFEVTDVVEDNAFGIVGSGAELDSVRRFGVDVSEICSKAGEVNGCVIFSGEVTVIDSKGIASEGFTSSASVSWL